MPTASDNYGVTWIVSAQREQKGVLSFKETCQTYDFLITAVGSEHPVALKLQETCQT